MERYVHALVWFILIVGIGYVGYYSFTKLSTDVTYTDTLAMTDPIEDFEAEQEGDIIPRDELDEGQAIDGTPEPESEVGLSEEDQKLLDGLQELVDVYGGVMKQGASGTRVGVIQTFLNVYKGEEDRTKGVDNQYGPGTKAAVSAFQSAEGLGSDGLAGPGTFQAMIDWLEENV